MINGTSRPPLIRLKLFTRAKGRLAAVYAIGFISWMGFNVNFLCDIFVIYLNGELMSAGPSVSCDSFLPTNPKYRPYWRYAPLPTVRGLRRPLQRTRRPNCRPDTDAMDRLCGHPSD